MPEPSRTTDAAVRPRGRLPRHALAVLLCYAALFVAFFAPVLFSDRLLAPGDGLVQSLPNFYGPRTAWDDMIWGGVPALADPQVMRWYPPAVIFSGLLHNWNGFVVVAYVLASCFTYGYVYTLTRARLAAAVAGITYGLSGFMMLHLCHVNIIHAAMLLPLMIWALEMLRSRWSAAWFAAGCGAAAGSLLSGHPQVPLYSLCLSAAAALVNGWRAPAGRWRYYGLATLMLALGLGLTGIQLVPTLELAGVSVRASFTFSEFAAYSLPLRQLPMLLFPMLYGGAPASFYALPYFGAWASGIDDRWGPSELGGYTGLLPLMLTFVGVLVYRRERAVRFWLAVGVLALLLALGPATPLARLVYHLPPLNKFRAAGRHLVEMTLAVSVLAGYGVSACGRRLVSARLVRRVVIVGGIIMLACAVGFVLCAGHYEALARQRGVGHLSLLPWANPATGLPLLLFAAAALTFIYWHGRPDSAGRSALLVVVLILDLASYGWFCEWHYQSPPKFILTPPPFALAYRSALREAHQRLLPVRGATGTLDELPPNLSKLWGLPSASGYGPLMLARVSRPLAMATHGAVDNSWQEAANRSLDLFAVRYLVLPRQDGPGASGHQWAEDDLRITLGAGCGGATAQSFTLDLPTPVRASQLGVVGALACSVQVPDGAEILRVTLTDVADQMTVQHLVAGRDTAEWAYDCPDVRPQMQHARAPVFSSYPARRTSVACEGHDYVSTLPVSAARPVKRIAFEWVGPTGSVALKKISLIDEQGGRSYPVTGTVLALADTARWRHAADSAGSSVYENLRALPRAWLVSHVRTVTGEEALNAIRTSRLPDGRGFDPARTALVEEALTFHAQPTPAPGTVEIVRLWADGLEARTAAAQDSFLVLSDVYYPGWRATIDGAPAHIYQTDYVLRGVAVPAGSHTVRLEFKSRMFPYGAATSAGSLVVLLGFTIFYGRRARQTEAAQV